ncbi:MAG: prevent-host-death protein [Erysipelotrichaceae bacterium]|nr:prevent-host-death protein [Erysipelotrichaceae bacterium]
MIATNYTQVRANLKSYMDHVRNNYEPLIITAKDGNVVLLSEEEYNNLLENNFIMSNRAMTDHLDKSIASLVNGDVIAMTLEDLKRFEKEDK